MKCSIMQPTYLPWAGYFNLIYKTDIFIFLDDAQFSKGSWHNRNRILNNSKETWVTIPLKKDKLTTNLNNYCLSNLEMWKKNHTNLIKQSYFRHPFYDCVQDLLDYMSTIKTNILSDLNISLIKFICEKLFIKNKFLQSSHLQINKKRTEKLVDMLEKYNINEYLSPEGAKDYLFEDNFYNKTNIDLKFNDYETKKYFQYPGKNNIYYDKLSIVDILANLGWVGTKNYIIDNLQDV